MRNYFKIFRRLLKRLFNRNTSYATKYKAVIAQSGDAIDVHGDYIYLNPACDTLLAHDFADLQFSFRFINGKVYSLIPNQREIKDYECSNTTGVQVCNEGGYYTFEVPVYYGGRVDGALGDVRDRSGKGHVNSKRWLVRDCPAATRDQPRKGGSSVLECATDDDDEQEFCENFVQNGLKNGLDRRRLIAQAIEARNQAT